MVSRAPSDYPEGPNNHLYCSNNLLKQMVSRIKCGVGVLPAIVTVHTYDAANRHSSHTWDRFVGQPPSVVTTQYSYSTTTGELLSVGYSGGTPDITYTYNRLGQQLTVTDALPTFTLETEYIPMEVFSANFCQVFFVRNTIPPCQISQLFLKDFPFAVLELTFGNSRNSKTANIALIFNRHTLHYVMYENKITISFLEYRLQYQNRVL